MPLRIALVASEVAPFAKTGGLGDVTSALGRYLVRRGHDVRTFLPLYGNLRTSGRTLAPVSFLQGASLELGGATYAYDVLTATAPGSAAPIYFVKNAVLYGRDGTYTADADELVRFAFLSRVALECCQRMAWAPDVVHCNDWHTALIPLYLLTLYSWDRLFAKTKTLLTIHNVGYQGTFSPAVADRVGLGAFRERLHQEDLANGRFSFLRTGILYADALSTVSETHSIEMQTPEQGMGMDGLLRARRRSFVGIVNGIDAEEWDPAHDPRIPSAYTASDLSGKAKDKEHLLGAFGLSQDPAVPLIAMALAACCRSRPRRTSRSGSRPARIPTRSPPRSSGSSATPAPTAPSSSSSAGRTRGPASSRRTRRRSGSASTRSSARSGRGRCSSAPAARCRSCPRSPTRASRRC